MSEDWWLKYVPTALESMEVYLKRVTDFEEIEFAMIEVTEEELETVIASYKILKPRFAYQPRLYSVMVIRDLIFLAYTERWWKSA
jgi:hypothetical protein